MRDAHSNTKPESYKKKGIHKTWNDHMFPTPGIEPGPRRWERRILTTRPRGMLIVESPLIDFFTDTVAILNLLDLRSFMGCPGGTRSVFTHAFRAKRELQRIFIWKKAIIITSKHGTKFFFTYYNLFLGKLKEKLARKAGANTDASISDRTDVPWASIILLKSN